MDPRHPKPLYQTHLPLLLPLLLLQRRLQVRPPLVASQCRRPCLLLMLMPQARLLPMLLLMPQARLLPRLLLRRVCLVPLLLPPQACLLPARLLPLVLLPPVRLLPMLLPPRVHL
jgi:hypothetical protein